MAENLIEVNDAVFGYGSRAVVRVAHLELAAPNAWHLGPTAQERPRSFAGLQGCSRRWRGEWLTSRSVFPASSASVISRNTATSSFIGR